MGLIKLAANLPTRVKIKYLDVRKKDHDPYVGINGSILYDNGTAEEGMILLPGSAPDVLSELARAGIIASVPNSMPERSGDKINVKVSVSDVMLTARLPAGEKYASLAAIQTSQVGVGNGHPSPAPTAAPPAAPAPVPPVALAWRDPLYLQVLMFVRSEVASQLIQPVTNESILTAAATLFIAADKRRH